MTDTSNRLNILLMEDNPADAERVRSFLGATTDGTTYDIFVAQTCRDAVTLVGSRPVDAVLLDLSLPDASGVTVLETMRDVTSQPIVVLTGRDEAHLARACLDAGAQDYLSKDGLDRRTLQRSIGYAIYRLRGEWQRAYLAARADYQRLSSAAAPTPVTSVISGSGPLRSRDPAEFSRMVTAYTTLLDDYLTGVNHRQERPRTGMESLVTVVGDHGGGPRDLMDVHVTALERVTADKQRDRTRTLLMDGRLMALEMMGILVDYYRSGYRRSWDRRLP